MEWSRYLVDERVMMFHPYIAKALGLNEAIFLQQLHYWLNRKPHIVEEKGWVYNPYRAWVDQLCFMSESTIKRTIKNLIDKGIVITANFNRMKFDRTLWYSIDYSKLDEYIKGIKLEPIYVDDTTKMELPLCQIEQKVEVQMTQPIPSTNTSTNNIKKESKKETEKTFNEIIDEYTDNEELRYELREYLKTRKSKKVPMTNRALQLGLKQLDKLTDNPKVKIEIVRQTILKGWTTFYELKDKQLESELKKDNSIFDEFYN